MANRVRYLVIFLVLCGLSFGATTIAQFGITWTFDKELSVDGAGDTYQTGTFVNGDHWVVGPVDIVDIDPASTDIASRTINGSMINPDPFIVADDQGFDSEISKYNVVFNAARPGGNDLNGGNPLTVTAGKSLVSTISDPDPSERNQLEDMAVLTVLSTAPADNSFRPPHAGSDKTINFNLTDLDYSFLYTLTPTDNFPSLETVTGWVERSWMTYKEAGEDFHPLGNMLGYGTGIADQIAGVVMLLNCDYSNAQKKSAMVGIVQVGIDMYGIHTNGGIDEKIWQSNGGHGGGWKLAILFAGKALGDTDMLSVGAKSGIYMYDGEYGPTNNPPDYEHFPEDDQIFYVKAEDVPAQPYDLLVSNTDGDKGDTTGNVKVTNGSAIVEGVGVAWKTVLDWERVQDYYFGVDGDIEAYTAVGQTVYTIVSFDSETQITLDKPYEGETNLTGNAEYAIAAWVGHGNGGIVGKNEYDQYVAVDIGLPEWGVNHDGSFTTSTPQWNASYRLTAGEQYGGTVIAVLMSGLKPQWNNNAVFDYGDRYMALMEGEGKRTVSVMAAEMYDTYRPAFGPIWPDQYRMGRYGGSSRNYRRSRYQ